MSKVISEVRQQMLTYITPFTDFGFKRIFGEKYDKDILIDFLNQVLIEEDEKIESIEYLPPEQLGESPLNRNAIFDFYCKNQKGEYIIIEMQKAEQDFFIERTIYYSTFPI